MFRAHELRARISADSTDFNRAAKDVNKSVSKMGMTMKGIATGVGVGIFAEMARGSLMAASAAEEIGTKYNTVFRGIGADAQRMSRELAQSFGLAQSTAQEMLSDTGDLLAGFGFDPQTMADMSERVSKLAIDLASFTNYQGGAKGAAQALTKALLGESEAAKALGIVIRFSDPDFIQRVNRLMELENMTLLQARAEAVLTEAYKQSANAIGDYDRTQDSTANTMRRLGEEWKGLRETLGKMIIDAGAADAMAGMAMALKEISEAVTGINEKGEKAANILSKILYLSPAAKALQNYAKKENREAVAERAMALLYGRGFLEIMEQEGAKVEAKAQEIYRDRAGPDALQRNFDSAVVRNQAQEAEDREEQQRQESLAADQAFMQAEDRIETERIENKRQKVEAEKQVQRSQAAVWREQMQNQRQYFQQRAQQAAEAIARLTSVSEYGGSYQVLAGDKGKRKSRRRLVQNEEEFIDDLSRLLRGDPDVKFNAFGKRRLRQLDMARGQQSFFGGKAKQWGQAIEAAFNQEQWTKLDENLTTSKNALTKIAANIPDK